MIIDFTYKDIRSLINSGLLITFGVLLQVIASVTWQYYDAGEIYYNGMQSAGEICYFLALRTIFLQLKKVRFVFHYFYAITDFAWNLAIMDFIDIIFLDPYNLSYPKYFNFIVSALILAYRIIKK